MTRLRQAIGACTLAYALFQTAVIDAATYYVATNGSNSNPGTEKQPWKMVAHAVNIMVAGDTTYVRGGTYNEGVILFKRSGTQAAPIKLLNYPGEAPIINCNPSTPQTGPFNRITILNQSGATVAIGWITIEGFEIRNCWDGIKILNGHDLTIRRNWIHDNAPGQGILGNGTRLHIDRNIVNHNGSYDTCGGSGANACNQDHGIYMHGTAFTITNNLIYDNNGYGIQQNGSSSSVFNATKHAGPEFSGAQNWIIANNVFAYERYRAGIILWGPLCSGTRIENNIFYENAVNLAGSPNGIDFLGSSGLTGVTIRNNLSFASGSRGKAFLGSGAKEGVHYTQSGNIVNEDEPRFVNAPAALPTSPNFALTERSPAIDKGMPLTVVTSSFDGMIRPQGRAHDIGAYEYRSGGDNKPPTAPILQAN